MKRIALPFLLSTVTFCFCQVNLNQGLQAFYPVSSNANNLNSNNINGVVNNVVLKPGRFNQVNSANFFNGSNVTSCNNWLSLPNNPSYATIGDLDVVGTQLTVEATMNRIPPLNSGLYYGHVVSKHTGPENINYAL